MKSSIAMSTRKLVRFCQIPKSTLIQGDDGSVYLKVKNDQIVVLSSDKFDVGSTIEGCFIGSYFSIFPDVVKLTN